MHIALALLFAVVVGKGVQKRPQEMARDAAECKLHMGVLEGGVVACLVGAGSNAVALQLFLQGLLGRQPLTADSRNGNQIGGIAGAGCGHGVVIGLGKDIDQFNPGRCRQKNTHGASSERIR